MHVKVKNARKDYLQKISTQIVKNHDAFAVENLNVSALMKNHKLAQAIADISWHTFFTMIEYKAQWLGKQFVKIGRFVPTSKTCSSCGEKQIMPLSIRIFKCNSCGLVLDRDLNASINIRAAGHAVLKACGAPSIS